MTRQTIHNPENDSHFMRLRPVNGTVRVVRKGTEIARTEGALWLLEHGRDYHDPVVYVPLDDLLERLEIIPDKTTHCPLKGDCSYFAYDGHEVGWCYDRPFPWSEMLSDFIAFEGDKVALAISGADA